MPLASRSSIYVLILWSGTALITAAITALAFYFLSDLGPHATAILKAYGAGALIAVTAESMIPEAFQQWASLFRRSRRWGFRSPHPSPRTQPVNLSAYII
jgi:zinc transporter ZupT